MVARKFLLLLLIVILAFGVMHAKAEEDSFEADDDEKAVPEAGDSDDAEAPEDVEDDEDKGAGAEGVVVRAQMGDGSAIPAGEWVTTLIGFENAAGNPKMEIEYVRAFLVSPQDFTYYMQNFTGTLYNRSADGGESLTLKYQFRPDVQLDPREYGLYVQVFYANDQNDTFLSTPFNETVVVADPVAVVDAKTVFTYVFLLSLLGVGGWFLQNNMGGKKKYSRPVAQSLDDHTGTEVNTDFVSTGHSIYLAKKASKSPKRSTN